jgi:hypothetical protein
MTMSTIYVRTLKRADHTVFCVADGQKTYYDPQFNRSIPYSSGQQIKRSLLEELSKSLKEVPSPTTFLFDVDKNGVMKEGEVYATCNPIYSDQLFGGWMKAAKGGKDRTLKRRSPLCISAMRGLHPLLSGIDSENISFDRSDRPNNDVIKRSSKCHYVIRTKTVQNFADIFFKSFDISRLEFHQFILHLVPKLFNAIEFWTVRRKEIERQPLLSQHFQQRLNCFPFVE